MKRFKEILVYIIIMKMNKRDLKKLTKSQLIELLLKNDKDEVKEFEEIKKKLDIETEKIDEKWEDFKHPDRVKMKEMNKALRGYVKSFEIDIVNNTAC